MTERQHTWAPAPTPGPSRQLLKRGLEARQGIGSCGYLADAPGTYGETILGLPLNCLPGSGCVTNTDLGAAGCCATDENLSLCSTVYTQCLDSTEFVAEKSAVGPATTYCPDSVNQFCADIFYPDDLTTFFCVTLPSQIYYATYADAAALSTSAAETTFAASSTTGVSSTVTSLGQKQTTAPLPAPTSPAATPAPVDASSPLSTGAVVGIAFAGALLILGALGFIYLMRRSKVKMAETKLRETTLMRQSFEDHQRLQQVPGGPPRSSMNTASWMAGPQPPPKSPEPGVTDYPNPASTGIHVGYNNRPGTFYDRESMPDDGPSHATPAVEAPVNHNGPPHI